MILALVVKIYGPAKAGSRIILFIFTFDRNVLILVCSEP